MSTEDTAPRDPHGEPLVCRPGDVFAGYEILRLVDSGGTCQIFEARHQVMERRVAIKMEKARLRAEGTRARRIIGEARALALLDHPNVIRIHHADVDERVGLFIVMELLEGQDLRSLLIRTSAARRPIPIDLACRIAMQIADALGAFHRVGVLHRDLKPENVFVTNGDGGPAVKVLDLGLAKFAGQRPETDEMTIVGTATYVAPEQLDGTVASHRSEVFSLGIILYELLTGEHPFRLGPGRNSTPRAIEALLRVKEATYEPLSSKRAEVPPALARFVERALAKLPENRPGSMLEFRQELERATRAGESELANLDETAPLGTRAPDLDATAPFGTRAPDLWSPTSGVQAPLSDLGPTIRMPMIEVSAGATLEPAPARPERTLPPFACDLSAELGSASLVLIEAPGAWRFMRIPVLGALTSRRGSTEHIGTGTRVPIPALPAITLRANGRGKVSVEGPVQRERSGELELYDTFRCGAYCFQLVPPTPDGLGIPIDYESRTVPYKTPLDVPSLLVRAGAVEAVMRKIPLRGRTAFVGGSPDLEVPLFRCELRVAARLTVLGEEERFGARLKVARADGAKVKVDGALGAEGVLGQLDTVEVEGWEFTLLPASRV